MSQGECGAGHMLSISPSPPRGGGTWAVGRGAPVLPDLVSLPGESSAGGTAVAFLAAMLVL